MQAPNGTISHIETAIFGIMETGKQANTHSAAPANSETELRTQDLAFSSINRVLCIADHDGHLACREMVADAIAQ